MRRIHRSQSRLPVLAGLLITAIVASWWWIASSDTHRGGIPHYRPLHLSSKQLYRITLWDYNYPVPNSLGLLDGAGSVPSYSQQVDAWRQAFTQQHPNIRVTIRLLDLSAGPTPLLTALADGDPPDVYASLWNAPPLDDALRVPVGPYRTAAGDPFLPVAWQAVSASGEPLAWPRWLAPRFWAVGGNFAQEAGLAGPRLTRQDLLTLLPYAQHHGAKLLTVDDGLAGLREWALASGVPSVAGSPWSAWQEPLAWLEHVRETGALDTQWDANGLRITSFAQGKAAVLAGVEPTLATALVNRLPDTLLVWPPAPSGQAAAPTLGISAVYVFRQENYGGDDHTQAAQIVAQSYAAWGAATFTDNQLLLPATSAGWKRWQREATVPPAAKAAALAAVAAADHGFHLYPTANPAAEEEIRWRSWQRPLHDWLQGRQPFAKLAAALRAAE